MYNQLLEEHRQLQTKYDDMEAEKEEAVARLRDANVEKDDRRNDRADTAMRAEIDRLRTELSVVKSRAARAKTDYASKQTEERR